MSEREKTLAELKPLIQRARDEGKWLWCRYQDLWFSPDQLEAANEKGRFIWGAANWQLRDPQERLGEAKQTALKAHERVATIAAEIGGAGHDS